MKTKRLMVSLKIKRRKVDNLANGLTEKAQRRDVIQKDERTSANGFRNRFHSGKGEEATFSSLVIPSFIFKVGYLMYFVAPILCYVFIKTIKHLCLNKTYFIEG